MRSQILQLALLGAASPSLAADCTRESLKAAADSLIAAQTAGDPSVLKPVSDSAAYTENMKAATLKSGIMTQGMKPDHTRSSLDTTQCATYTEMIFATAAKPYVMGVQMRWEGASINKIDLLATTTGDWLFNATGTLNWASKEDWGTIPEAKRDTRAVIQAAADAYCDVFNDKSVKVPWGSPCARLEGGSYTGKGTDSDKCDVGIPNGVALTNRHYVIDETVGAVDIMMTFGGNLPDSHEFRVESGKLRFVHTITVMSGSKGKKSGKGGKMGGTEGATSRIKRNLGI